MVAVTIALSMILAAVVLSNTPFRAQVNIHAGDYFHYGMTGSGNGTTFSDEMNFTVDKVSETLLQWHGRGHAEHGQVDAGDFGPFSSSNAHFWLWVGNEMISTPFGDKCVKVMWHYEMLKDQLFILNVGVDSSFPYREIMTNSTSSDHYSIELAGSNNTDLIKADTVMRSADINGWSKLSVNPGMPEGWTCESGAQGRNGVILFGSVQALEGQHFRYNTTGNDSSVFVLTFNDFKTIEATGKFSFNASLSKPSGVEGEVDVSVKAGTYWYFILLRGDEGWFIGYW